MNKRFWGTYYPIRCEFLHQNTYIVVDKNNVKYRIQTYDLIRLAKLIDPTICFEDEAYKAVKKKGLGVFRCLSDKAYTPFSKIERC